MPSADSGGEVNNGVPFGALEKGRYIRPFFRLAM